MSLNLHFQEWEKEKEGYAYFKILPKAILERSLLSMNGDDNEDDNHNSW